MQDDILTIVEEGKAQRLQVNWRNVSFTDLTGGEIFFTSFDDLDNKLVKVGYNLAKLFQNTIATENYMVPIETILHFKGKNNFNNELWENGDCGIGFLFDGIFIPSGYWNGGSVSLTSPILQDINNWITSPFDPYASQ